MKFAGKSLLVVLHVVFGASYFIGKNITSFANTVGKIGIKAPDSFVLGPLRGIRIPGDGLKMFVNLLGTPFKWVGDNFKTLLVIDAIILAILLLMKIVKMYKQSNALDEISGGDEATREKYSKLMDSFK